MIIDIDLKLYPELANEANIEQKIKYLLQIGYNNVFIDQQNILLSKINSNIKNEIVLSNNKVNLLNNQINKLFGLSCSSSKKGEISEDIIYKLINNKFQNYNYQKTRHIAHNADGLLTNHNGLNSLIEIKNYENTVNIDEIKKFKNDLKYNNIKFGIFISIKSGIIGKKIFDLESYLDNDNEYTIIYISKIYMNELLIENAILLLEQLHNISNNNNTIKKTILFNNLESHFNELNTIINKNNNLNDEFILLESTIKKSFDNFYSKFRNYEIDLKNQVKLIWTNIQKDIDNVYLNSNDNKEDILNKIKNDKLLIVITKLFEVLSNYDIIINNNIWDIVINNKIIGTLKKLKDKVNIEIEDSIKITLTIKNYEKNLLILKKCL